MPSVSAPRRPELRGVITSLWVFEARLEHRLERVLPCGGLQILVNLHEDRLRALDACGRVSTTRAGAVLQGPHDRVQWVDTRDQRWVAGAVVATGAAPALFREPPSALVNRLVDLELLWGRAGQVLHDRLRSRSNAEAVLDAFEAALVERRRAVPVDAVAREAARALEGRRSVAATGDALGVSRRTLARRFEAATGFGPKRWARLCRLQRVVQSAAECAAPDWAALALDLGYADQSHLVNEFRAFSGVSPTAYRPRAADDPNHLIAQPPALDRATRDPFFQDGSELAPAWEEP